MDMEFALVFSVFSVDCKLLNHLALVSSLRINRKVSYELLMKISFFIIHYLSSSRVSFIN